MAKKKKKIQNEASITLTQIGWITDGLMDDFASLDMLMRKFESAKRFSRERIFEGMDRKETVELSKPKFIPNSRYMRDAFLEAEANIASNRENLPRYVEQNKQNLKNTEKRMEQLTKEMERHIQKEEFKKAEKKEQILLYKKHNLKKFEKNIRHFQYHIDNESVPKPVDGSKQLLKQLKKGKATKEQWRNARSNNLFARGRVTNKKYGDSMNRRKLCKSKLKRMCP